MTELKRYTVWDAGTRWFHWINVLCVTALAVVGIVILNAGDLGVPNAGKVTLKTVHTWVGYVFALNLLWRIVWGFRGNRYARWRSILPVGKGYFQALRRNVAAFFTSQPEHYLGHNPLGRLSVTAMLLLLAIQAITGLVLAGTDLFYPPSGIGSRNGWPRRALPRIRWRPIRPRCTTRQPMKPCVLTENPLLWCIFILFIS